MTSYGLIIKRERDFIMRSRVRKTLLLACLAPSAAMARALRGCSFAAALAVSILTFAGAAWGQAPPAPLPPAEAPAAQRADADVAAPTATPAPATVAAPTYYPNVGWAAPQQMGLFDTIRASLFDDNTWRPLSLGTFFSEGWNEPWAGGPAGQSGLTPRHGWLGSFEGVFYRLWLVNNVYQYNLNRPYGGEGYSSSFITFLPFSRRFELFLSVPFITANGTEDPNRGYRSDFGDISLAGSFLLSESEAFTQLFTLGATLPTGQTGTGGNLAAVNPRYSFWSNPCDAWVVRAGMGVNIPLNKNDQRPAPVVTPTGEFLVSESTAQTTFNGNMAVGRYFRPHDVPFGDLVFYVNLNVTVPLEDRGEPTFVGFGPGTRFRIGGDWYFLNYWEFQVGNDKPYDFNAQVAILKTF
jgi:hypothetical protein